jgi:hypothetical protein
MYVCSKFPSGISGTAGFRLHDASSYGTGGSSFSNAKVWNAGFLHESNAEFLHQYGA